jgi:hypothetical protein
VATVEVVAEVVVDVDLPVSICIASRNKLCHDCAEMGIVVERLSNNPRIQRFIVVYFENSKPR